MTDGIDFESLSKESGFEFTVVDSILSLPVYPGNSFTYDERRDITRRSLLLALEASGIPNIPASDRNLLNDVCNNPPDYVAVSMQERFERRINR